MRQDRPAAKLLFVRHGLARAVDGGYGPETPLCDLGRRQAALVVDALREPVPALVYTSPWPRALETATPLCARLGVAPVAVPGLEEFVLDAAFIGAPGEGPDQRPDLQIWRADQRGREGGETLGEFAARVGGCCEAIARRHVGERIALFAHSGTIDAAVRWAMGMPYDAPWHSDGPIENASITEIDYWPDGRVVGGAPRYGAIVRHGDVSHLGALNVGD